MGEVVVSSEDVERKSEKAEAARNFFDKKKEASSSAVTGLLKWEKLLRRMALRVLLVEADDSTRQIIAALLRKCCYRVAAVSDGLKAWEMLKERPRSVDLILTEVELPAISGYALLSLIMEHEICKNIPVIMMSRQDSVNTVYRCMLRGAADYLVKPVRRNELRNLWQHVWRRRSWIEGGIARQEDESVGQKRVEATSENNPASNHSSGNKACVERNTEHVDNESDDQSSCTRPDLEAESAPVKYMQEFSGKSLPNELPKHEALIKFSQEEHMLDSNSEGAHMDTHMPNVHKDFEPKDQGKHGNFSAEASNSFMDFSKVAIDFMGTSNNHKTSSINVRSSLDSLPELNLSLRKSHTSVVENQGTKDHPTLWHPKASAFTRYVAKQMQPPCMLSSSITGQSKECQSNSEKKYPCIMTDYSSDTPSPTLTTQRSGISQGAGQSKQSEVGASCPLSSICPAPVPANGITLNSHHNSYSSGVVPVFSMQSNPSSVMTPRSVNPQESVFRMNPHYPSTFETINSGQFYDHRTPDANCAGSQPLCKPEKQLSFLQDMGLVSPANDLSKNSSLCNGSTSHFNNIGYGSTCASNSNADQATAIGTSVDSKNEDGLLGQGGGTSRSMQREAALTKFRLKRKDRCFEKKVRYESRKKLAEQRPRVKGQFVRQVWNDSHSMETKCHYGNASSG